VINAPVPRIVRQEVPENLQHLLAQAMTKGPASRPQSAMQLAKSLQGIEADVLGLTPTAIAVRSEEALASGVRPTASAASVVEDDAPPTAIGPVRVVPATAPPLRPPTEPPTAPRTPTAEMVSDTVHQQRRTAEHTALRQGPAAIPDGSVSSAIPKARNRTPFVAAAAAVVVVLGVVAVVLGSGSGDPKASAQERGEEPDAPSASSPLVFVEAPPMPSDVTVSVSGGKVSVAWAVTGEASSDTYRVNRVDGAHANDAFGSANDPPFVVAVAPGEHPCFQVMAVRGDRVSEPSIPVCAP
jgi:hypothetical protein